ncbi:hypothetical protein PG990_002814 [Apiospora arundinis]
MLETIQDILLEQASCHHPACLLIYSVGNTHNPTRVTYDELYRQAKQLSYTVQSLDPFEPGHPVLLHFDDHWNTILWFWSVLFSGGLPVLSSPFSNVESDRHKHVQHLSNLLESPICITKSRLLPLFGSKHGVQLHAVEHLIQEIRSDLDHGGGCDHRGQNGHRDIFRDKQEQSYHDSHIPSSKGAPDRYSAQPESRHHKDNIAKNRNLAMLMLTSGSTGSSKAVEITHKQVLAAVYGKASVRLLPKDRPLLNWIGLDHVASLVEIHLQALWLGVDQVHVHASDIVPSPMEFFDLISRHSVSRTFAPNFFLARLVSALDSVPSSDEKSWDLSSLICVASGGEANDVRTCVAASALFRKYGAPPGVITPGFGMTETCAGAIFNTNCPSDDVSNGRVVASVGECMIGIQMRITAPGNSGGGSFSPNVPGDLEVRGPVVFQGYYRNEGATKQAFTPDGWFRTGDQGLLDPSGNLCLVGRTKDVININGVKMITADIQTAIERVLDGLVARLVVFPSRASHTEQATVAYIPKSFPERDEDRTNIVRLATQECLTITATRPLVFGLREQSLSSLPLSTLGKISRMKTASLFQTGQFEEDIKFHELAMDREKRCAPCQADRWNSNITTADESQLIKDVAQVLNTTPETVGIHAETSIFDIGFTSMHVIKLKYCIEQRLGIDVPIIHIMKHPTIRSLAADLADQVRCSEDPVLPETAVTSYDPVVVFCAKGTKPPLWLFHPGVGEVLVFVGLAQQLAIEDDRPVFALRAAGFEAGQACFASIPQAVDTYAAAIRRRQPHGPYALAGYSYGAMLAFETAKRLRDGGDGAEVPFLASLNLPPHIRGRMRQLRWNTCLLHLAHFLGLVDEDLSDTLEADANFCALPRAAALTRVLEVADGPRLAALGLGELALARWVDVAYELQSMAADYQPVGLVDSLDVFHAVPLRAVASSREEWLRDHLSRWSEFVRGPPRFHAVGGTHYTMIGEEHVASFADTLVKAMKMRGI